MPEARTRTRTWSPVGCGVSTSCISNTSGPPGLVIMTARMKFCSFNVFHHNISQKQAWQQAINAGKRRIGAWEGGESREGTLVGQCVALPENTNHRLDSCLLRGCLLRDCLLC